MNLKLTFTVHFLIGISISVIKVEGLRCYVCGGDGELPCNDFDLKKDTFVKKCLDSNKGCEKQIIDRRVILKCSDNSLNDCKEANGIGYCYCMTDLCNTNNMSKLMGLTDDEDFIEDEGSGITTVLSGTEKSVVVTKGKSLGSKIDLYCSLIFLPLVVMLYNN